MEKYSNIIEELTQLVDEGKQEFSEAGAWNKVKTILTKPTEADLKKQEEEKKKQKLEQSWKVLESVIKDSITDVIHEEFEKFIRSPGLLGKIKDKLIAKQQKNNGALTDNHINKVKEKLKITTDEEISEFVKKFILDWTQKNYNKGN